MAKLRLDKFVSDLGIASRKDIKQMIRSGRITLNGGAAAAEAKVDTETDRVELDGEALHYRAYRYYMMDKPCGVLSATEDGKQKTVLDLVNPEMRRMELFPVGRLDKDTSGLLLLTNDGEFAHRVISPKSGVEKLYYARVEGTPTPEDVCAFSRGIVLSDGTQCLPARLKILGENECLVVVMEGKYHQVKRMLASRGTPVTELRRLAIGALSLPEELGPGGFRELTSEDLCKVFSRENIDI